MRLELMGLYKNLLVLSSFALPVKPPPLLVQAGMEFPFEGVGEVPAQQGVHRPHFP